MNEHEEKTVDAFLVKEKRDRFKAMLANPGKRAAFLDRLNHFRDFDERCVTWLPSNASVEELLRLAGSPAQVSLLSATREIDGQVLPLDEAIRRTTLGGWGTIVSCVAGELAYYYDEVGTRRALLRCPPNTSIS